MTLRMSIEFPLDDVAGCVCCCLLLFCDFDFFDFEPRARRGTDDHFLLVVEEQQIAVHHDEAAGGDDLLCEHNVLFEVRPPLPNHMKLSRHCCSYTRGAFSTL